MKAKPINLSEVENIFSYDPYTGKIYWKIDTRNTKSGDEAGYVHRLGYIKIKYKGRPMQASRLAWVLHYKEDANGVIDHIDGDKTNNTIKNLRVVTSQENNMNSRVRSHNILGIKGVREKNGRFQARITKDGKLYNLGWFDSAKEARNKRIKAEKEMFGRYAFSNRCLNGA